MQFQDWNEDSFVQYLADNFQANGSIVGIGDDCAVIPVKDSKALLITTDALVEGIHFLTNQITARDLGYKCIAVNVSDIAAMGGRPQYAFLSIAIPKTTERKWACEAVQGIKDACEKWNIQLLGGDTVGSKRDIFINVTLVGSADAKKIKYRHEAKIDDIICVTNHLGDSGAGFKAAQEQIPESADRTYLLKAHFHPEPNPEHGIWLASHPEVHAMMDLSDGLDCDLTRLIKRSQKGAEIELSAVPLSDPLKTVCLEYGWDPLEFALTGGEDYSLLLTISAEAFKDIQASFRDAFGTSLFAIGRIKAPPMEVSYCHHGKAVQMHYKFFDHFQ